MFFSKLPKIINLFAKLLVGCFQRFCKKNQRYHLNWQTIGDVLTKRANSVENKQTIVFRGALA
jgi:hypothetical protein